MSTLTIKSSAGFSMIEVLVSVVVLSIGLLGIASLQTLGQQFNYRAYLRTQATFLAYDMMDRMRANRATAVAGGYALDKGDKPNMTTDCNKQNCDPSSLASYDLAVWYNLIENNLPEPTVSIEWNGGASEYKITFDWAEERGEAKGANRATAQIWTIRP